MCPVTRVRRRVWSVTRVQRRVWCNKVTKGSVESVRQRRVYCNKGTAKGVVARGQFAAPATEESKMSAKQDCCHGSDKRFQDLKSKCCQQIQNPNKRIWIQNPKKLPRIVQKDSKFQIHAPTNFKFHNWPTTATFLVWTLISELKKKCSGIRFNVLQRISESNCCNILGASVTLESQQTNMSSFR